MLAPRSSRAQRGSVDAIRLIAYRHGISVAQLALAWVLHQPGVAWALAWVIEG
jgi:aryl-alcohol dehydrogenase-like predicted oxidoreductase